MTDAWWRTLLREQQGSGFADLEGAEGRVVLPVSDRFLSALIAARLPASVPISSLQVVAAADNRFTVRIKLRTPAFLPSFSVHCEIVGQPQLPSRPVLTVMIDTGPIAFVMGPLVRMFASLPAWITIAEERVHVDIRRLADQHHMGQYLDYVTRLQITTAPGRFVVQADAALPPSR